MSGLIDLLPDDIGEEKKKEYARKSAEIRKKTYKALTKEELSRKEAVINERHRSFEEWSNVFESKSKVLRRAAGIKTKKTPFKKNAKKGVALNKKRIRNLKRAEENKKRELAKSGIIVYDHVFMRLDDGFSIGRKKSLEWNDEIAKKNFGKRGKRRKKLGIG